MYLAFFKTTLDAVVTDSIAIYYVSSQRLLKANRLKNGYRL